MYVILILTAGVDPGWRALVVLEVGLLPGTSCALRSQPPPPAAFVHSMSFSVWRWPVGGMVAVVGLRGVAPPEGHSMGLAAGPGA